MHDVLMGATLPLPTADSPTRPRGASECGAPPSLCCRQPHGGARGRARGHQGVSHYAHHAGVLVGATVDNGAVQKEQQVSG